MSLFNPLVVDRELKNDHVGLTRDLDATATSVAEINKVNIALLSSILPMKIHSGFKPRTNVKTSSKVKRKELCS